MTKIEMSQYYFDCYYIRNNSKYNITFCRDAVSCLDQAYEWFYVNGISDNSKVYVYLLMTNTFLNDGENVTTDSPYTVKAGKTGKTWYAYAFAGKNYFNFTINSEILWTLIL